MHEELQNIVEQLADGVLILGNDGTIRYANAAAAALFGRPRAGLIGADLGFPVVSGAAEVELVHPSGKTVTAEIRVADTAWGEGGRVITLRDITERKVVEERIAQLNRERIARAEAEAASQAKSNFLATMSHELRTPLNAVIGYAELLDYGVAGSLNDGQRDHIARIRHSARHLLGLVNEVLDLARVEAGRLSVQKQPAAVVDVIDAALSLVQPPAEAKGILLRGFDCGKGIVYRGDDNRVRQIIVNLLNNAVKFTPTGGTVSVECEVVTVPGEDAHLSGAGPWVRLRVADTGIGIPADRIASVFDPFVQVDEGRTRAKDGSGLGLTISRRLARLMDGDLTVRSEPGRGSVFTLWLCEAGAAERHDASWRAASPDAAARLQGLSRTGDGLLRELPRLTDAFVNRLRAERIVPNAHVLRATQLADHLPGFVAIMASMLKAIEEARGHPARLIAEGAELLTIIADRHGQQRARLGWTTGTIHREWTVLREEIELCLRRVAAGVGEVVGVPEAMIVLERFLEQGEDVSAKAVLLASQEQEHQRTEREDGAAVANPAGAEVGTP